MVTNEQLFKKYGDPASKTFQRKWLMIWDVPTELEVGFIPKRIYCNRDLVGPLATALLSLIQTGYVKELKSWDGCWNLRPVRGYEKRYEAAVKAGKTDIAIAYLSVHSWADAIDVNAAENGLGKKPKLSKGFVQCFKDAGFDWGGDWKRLDGMHFQLSNI